MTPHPTVVGINEIARRLGFSRRTVNHWRQQHLMPDPPWHINGGPVWHIAQIEAWVQMTGRRPKGPRK